MFYTVFLSKTKQLCRLPWFSQPLKGKNDKVDPLQTVKAHSGVEARPHSFIISAQYEGEWSTSRPGKFTSGKETQYPLVQKLPCEDTPGYTAMPKPKQFLHFLKI
jgi:hypothetical protein